MWKEYILANPKTLFLFVHDEAHWYATANKEGAAPGAWQEATGADMWINDDVIRLQLNVVTLFVSATPYNLLTRRSQVPENNTKLWFTPGDDSRYYGLAEFTKRSREREESLEQASPAEEWLTAVPPGCIRTDKEFEEAAGLPRSGKISAWNVSRKDMLAKQYVKALEEVMGATQMERSNLELEVSDVTRAMVTDLLTISSEGKGIMILIRVIEKKHGWDIHNAIHTARRALGLQDKFALVIDVDATRKGSLRKCIDDVFIDKMAKRQGKTDTNRVTVDAYSDLQDLPCVLILCEKGKMGDTFPESLRHYDLRLRYANSCDSRATAEQDLGRGFRYVKPGREDRLPTVLVGPAVYKALGIASRKAPTDFWKRADGNMTPRRGLTKDQMPKDEYDMIAYRNQYTPNAPKKPTSKNVKWVGGHFDAQYKDREEWQDNPHRFLLVGLPQIGKTGAFLHLMYLLWDHVDNHADRTPGRYVPGPDPEPPDCLEDTTMGKFPIFSVLEQIKWGERDHKRCPESCLYAKKEQLNDHGNYGCPDHSACYAKYGDPKVERLWEWSVTNAKKERHPEADQYSSASLTGAIAPLPPPRKTLGTKKSSAPRCAVNGVGESGSLGADVAVVEDAEDSTETQASEILHSGQYDFVPWSGKYTDLVPIKSFAMKAKDPSTGLVIDLGE